MKEEDLGEQHRGHRLASLVQTCMDSQQEPPCTVLQTLYGASTASSNGARVVDAAIRNAGHGLSSATIPLKQRTRTVSQLQKVFMVAQAILFLQTYMLVERTKSC